MFTLLKILFAIAVIVPLVLIAALLGGVMLAVVVGIAGAIIGIAFFLLKAALFLVLPLLLVIWLFSRLFGHRGCGHPRDLDVNEWA